MRWIILLYFVWGLTGLAGGQTIVAYYTGDGRDIEAYPIGELTHLVYGFCHLRNGRLSVDGRADSLAIRRLVRLKARYRGLKILLSLGGWGGCRTCSEVFSTQRGREVFAGSAAELADVYGVDGIDIDWEFPALPTYPGHAYSPEDREHLTEVVELLKKRLGTREVTLTAAGFSPYLEGSVDWVRVAGVVDRIQLMTYDMIGSRNKYTGHHTPLYSTAWQTESTDRSVRYLDSLGVERGKVAIGVALYAREFVVMGGDVGGRGNDGAVDPGSYGGARAAVDPADPAHGLDRPGRFRQFVTMRRLRKGFGAKEGYGTYWDSIARAPYRYNTRTGSFLTYDDERSVAEKARYVVEKKLNGVVVWALGLDVAKGGLLDVLYKGLKRTNFSRMK